MDHKDFYIVCVDDDEDVLDITVQLVRECGFLAVGFGDVTSAIEYIKSKKHQVAMILSDLRMDDINGFNFKAALKDIANDIPFVIITGYWTKEMSAEAMGLGIDAFIEKPVSLDILKNEIENFGKVKAEALQEELEMVEGFIEESAPMLDEIEQLILEFEEQPGSDQILSTYFRLLHTIKGTAACVGLHKLAGYTHHYEDFISELRKGTIAVDTNSTNALLKGLDDLKIFFRTIKDDGIDTDSDISDSDEEKGGDEDSDKDGW